MIENYKINVLNNEFNHHVKLLNHVKLQNTMEESYT